MATEIDRSKVGQGNELMKGGVDRTGAKLVPVEFLVYSSGYNKGETAAFSAEQAKHLVERKVARYKTVAKPAEQTAATAGAPGSPAKA